MGYIQGEGRSQGTLFPMVLDDFVPTDHACRVIDAFVDGLSMNVLFERSEAADLWRQPRTDVDACVLGSLAPMARSEAGSE